MTKKNPIFIRYLQGWGGTWQGKEYASHYPSMRRKHWIDIFRKHILTRENDKLFLDVGCTEGLYVLEAVKQGAYGVGVDLFKPSIKKAKALSVKFNYSDQSDFIVADGSRLPFKDDCFSLCLCSEVLEHSPSPSKIVQEISRVSQYVIVSVPLEMNYVSSIKRFFTRSKLKPCLKRTHSEKLPIYGHRHFFTSNSAKQLLATNGLEIINELTTPCLLFPCIYWLPLSAKIIKKVLDLVYDVIEPLDVLKNFGNTRVILGMKNASLNSRRL